MPHQHLQRAASDLEAGAAVAALEALLLGWRACRAAELAERIELLSTRIARAQPALSGKTQRERLQAWVDCARLQLVEDRGRLIASLMAGTVAAESVVSGPPQGVVARLDEVVQWKDDPRVASLGLVALAWPGHGATWAKVFSRAFKCLEVANDPRTISGLAERLVAERAHSPLRTYPALREYILERGESVLAKLTAHWPGGVPSLSETGSGALRAFDEALARWPEALVLPPAQASRASGEIKALWDAVYASPGDDAPRAVLADALLERADPRGEFIALQLRNAADPKSRRREAALLKKHAREWLGPLKAVVGLKGAVFDRGFLWACVAEAKEQAQARLEFASREWATVERLRFAGATLVTPAMRHARALDGLPLAALKALAALSWPRLEHLGVEEFVHGAAALVEGTPALEGLRALANAALPALTSLSLRLGKSNQVQAHSPRLRRPRDYQWLLKTPWGPQLRELTVDAELTAETIAVDWLNAAKDFALRTLTLFDHGLTLDLDVASGELRLTQPRGRPVATLVRAIEALDATQAVTRLTIATVPPVPFTDPELAQLRTAAGGLSRWELRFG